jgi:hypothetical protein
VDESLFSSDLDPDPSSLVDRLYNILSFASSPSFGGRDNREEEKEKSDGGGGRVVDTSKEKSCFSIKSNNSLAAQSNHKSFIMCAHKLLHLVWEEHLRVGMGENEEITPVERGMKSHKVVF